MGFDRPVLVVTATTDETINRCNLAFIGQAGLINHVGPEPCGNEQ